MIMHTVQHNANLCRYAHVCTDVRRCVHMKFGHSLTILSHLAPHRSLSPSGKDSSPKQLPLLKSSQSSMHLPLRLRIHNAKEPLTPTFSSWSSTRRDCERLTSADDEPHLVEMERDLN